MTIRLCVVLLLAMLLTGCMTYPPALAPTRGQTAGKQEDAKDCDHQVHSAGRSMFLGAFTAWSTEERDKYVACMRGKGYTPAK
jgi:starvation-inducible outer membrane lipoprotein